MMTLFGGQPCQLPTVLAFVCFFQPFVSPDSSVFNYDSEASLDSEDDFENNCTSDDDDELDSARPKTL